MFIIKAIFHYDCVNVTELGLAGWKFTVDYLRSSIVPFQKGMVHSYLIFIYQTLFQNSFLENITEEHLDCMSFWIFRTRKFFPKSIDLYNAVDYFYLKFLPTQSCLS
jgi:hypothetical protein